MTPFWQPWPGESVVLNIARPEAIEGESLTIRQAIHKMDFGSRQRKSTLKLSLQTSLGRDFIMTLPQEAEVSSLKLNNRETPVRREGNKIIIPLSPGAQEITLDWKTPHSIGFKSISDELTLPVECANISTSINYSSNSRWVLWTSGPLRGPAVRMWPLLIIAIIAGLAMGKIPQFSIKRLPMDSIIPRSHSNPPCL